MIDVVCFDGCDIFFDIYFYFFGCIMFVVLLFSWVSLGGLVEILKRLQDEILREKIRRVVEDIGCDGGYGIFINWDEIQVS